MRFGLAIGIILSTFVPANAVDVAFTAAAGFGITLEGSSQTVTTGSGGAIAFDTADRSTGKVLVEIPANLVAFHIRENGNYLLSANTEITFGGLTFDDAHIAEYDPATGVATTFLDYSDIIETNLDADIDAFFELPNGNHVFSNETAAVVADVAISENDLVEYNPINGTASIFFDGNLITDGDRFNNVSGASLFSDGRIALAVSTGGTALISLGGAQFTRNDIVVYDPNSGTATLLFEGDDIRTSPVTVSVNGVHIGAAVSEPSSLLLIGFAILGLTAHRRRFL